MDTSLSSAITPDAVYAASQSKRLSRMAAPDAIADMLNNPNFGDVRLVSSFGADAAVLLHLVAQVNTSTPVLFVNTGKLFDQTLLYKQQLVGQFGLTNVTTLTPDPAQISIRDADDALWLRNANACCALRKVAPLEAALDGVCAWMSGRKSFQSNFRASLELIEVVDGRYKLNPLVGWSAADINDYFIAHDLPRHPLVAHGFLSIGCQPCTTPVRAGEDPRAGRWRNSEKTECGIHAPIEQSAIVAAHAA